MGCVFEQAEEEFEKESQWRGHLGFIREGEVGRIRYEVLQFSLGK